MKGNCNMFRENLLETMPNFSHSFPPELQQKLIDFQREIRRVMTRNRTKRITQLQRVVFSTKFLFHLFNWPC